MFLKVKGYYTLSLIYLNVKNRTEDSDFSVGRDGLKRWYKGDRFFYIKEHEGRYIKGDFSSFIRTTYGVI